MRIIAFTGLILAAGIAAAAAQPAYQLPGAATRSVGAPQQQQLTPGQSWVVAQESLALESHYRLSAMSAQLAQARESRAVRHPPIGRPQRELR